MVLFTARGEAMSHLSVKSTYITDIGSAAEWSEFCAAVNGGYDYDGVEVRLAHDITEVSDIAGTSSHCFKGIFNGQGHTITFCKTVTDSTQYTAPIGFIDGAIVKNLKVTGLVTSNGRFAGGVVAYAKGSSTVTNCFNSTIITSTASGTSNGGIVGMVGGAGTLTITGCVFNGEMHGTITADWCGILGLCNGSCYATITDCLFVPTAIDEGLKGHTIYRQGNDGNASQSNCFYTQTMNHLYGTQVYSVTGGENVIVAMDGTANNTYDVSGFSYYDAGLTFNDIVYATNGENVSLNLDYDNLPEGPSVAYSADNGTLSGDSNPYTLEMAASNTTISATVLPLRNEYGDYFSWEYFANHPRDCGNTIYLECDITVTTMVSGSSWNIETGFYNSTFNGQNHTITLAIDTTINEAGLFRYVNNVYIRNLKLEGTIHSSSGNTASLIGLSQQFVSISNCHSNVTVSNDDGQNGVAGFIAFASDLVYFYGCDFTGVLAGSSSEQNGGFVGRYTNGREHSYRYCVFAPSSISEQVTNGCTFDPYPSTNYTNCFYTTPFGTAQGEQFYTITGDTDVNVVMHGETSTYSASGITSYSGNNGLLYNGTIIAGEDRTVWLDLSSEQSGRFYTDNVLLNGTSNPYWFSMPAEDVVVRIAPAMTITVTANLEEGGTVTGGGSFAVNDTCTLVASPYRGYAFINWTVDGVEVSTDTTYTFNVSESATFVANFEALEAYQITATANPASMGSVTGVGTYYDTEVCTLVALPNTTFGFVNWTEDGIEVSTDATYIFTVDNDRNLVANFEKVCDYYEDFEDIDNPSPAHDTAGPLPANWSYSYEGSRATRPHVQNATEYPGKISGDNYLCLNAASNASESYAPYSYAIMPDFASNVAPKRLSFKYRFEDAGIGILTYGFIDGLNTDTYTVLGTIQNPSSNPGIVDVDLDPNQTEGKRIAFRWYYNLGWFTCGIDDVCVKFQALKKFKNDSGDGRWETAGNWRPVGVPTLDENVTIQADVTIGAGVLAKANDISRDFGHTITIEDGGQLWHNNEGVTATMKKNIVGYSGELGGGWNFIASPISTNIHAFAAGLITDDNSNPNNLTFDFYCFDQTGGTDGKEWRNYRRNLFDLYNGQGYLYANVETIELEYKGSLYNGNGVVPLTYTAGKPFSGWNLVGNPFACNATIDQSFYVIDGTSVVPNTGSTIIPPCTGVMVKADGTNQSVTFTKTMEQQSSQPNQLQITLRQVVEPVETPVWDSNGPSTGSGTLTIDKAIVSFNEGDRLEKLVFNADNAKIYIPQGGKDYAIAFSDRAGEMPLNFKATEDGIYTLTIEAEEVSFSYLHLIDNKTGADVDLLSGDCGSESAMTAKSYTFTAKTTDYESRFKLVFASVCEDADGDNETFAFFNGSEWFINVDGPSTGSGTYILQVIDMMGRILSSETISGSVSKTIDATPGVYILKLNDKVQKIIIR